MEELEVINPLKDKKVLIADDNDTDRLVAIKFLERVWILKENIQVVENGRAAVEISKQRMFDLIVMDISMPEMNGLEATKEIILQHKAKSPKIIAYTASEKFKDDPRMELMDGMYLKATSADNFKEVIKNLQWETSEVLSMA